MITSDPVAAETRPASPLAVQSYRPSSREIVAAAARSGARLPSSALRQRQDQSRYEFPGDRTFERYLRSVDQ